MPIVLDSTGHITGLELTISNLALRKFAIIAQNGLPVVASIVVDAAKRTAPKHIGDYIKQSKVEKIDEEHYEVEVFVSLKDAPDAAAWEYGSGLHRTKGSPNKYSIDAVNVPDLVFWWEREQVLFVGPHVNHPGIAARPYLQPAVRDNLDRIKAEFLGHVS